MKFLNFFISTLFHVWVLCPCLFFTWNAHVEAQQVITVEEVLKQTNSSISTKWIKEGLVFLDQTPQGLPYIEKLEFRSETDEFDLGRQEYLLRSSFNSSKMRKIHEQKMALSREELLIKNDNYKSSIIAEYYHQIAEWHFIEIEKQQLLEEKTILEDKKMVFQKIMNNTFDLDLEAFLKLEKNLQETLSAIVKLDHQKAFIISQLLGDAYTTDSIQLSKTNWITIEEMYDNLIGIKGQSPQNRILVQQQLKVDKAELEEQEEKAESQKVLDFVQIKYAGRNNLEFGNELSLGFGLNIPTRSKGRVKQNEARLDMIEEQIELEQLQWEVSKELSHLNAHFDLLKKEYEVLQKYIEQNEWSATYEKYKSTEGIDPMSLLSMKESILKNQQQLTKIEKEATMTYLTIIKTQNAFPIDGKENILLLGKKN